MPVGVAPPRRDLQPRRPSCCLPAADVRNFARSGARDRLGEAKHAIFPPEGGFRCRSKGEKFDEYKNPVPDRTDGQASTVEPQTRAARGRGRVLPYAADAAPGVDRNDGLVKRGKIEI